MQILTENDILWIFQLTNEISIRAMLIPTEDDILWIFHVTNELKN